MMDHDISMACFMWGIHNTTVRVDYYPLSRSIKMHRIWDGFTVEWYIDKDISYPKLLYFLDQMKSNINALGPIIPLA